MDPLVRGQAGIERTKPPGPDPVVDGVSTNHGIERGMHHTAAALSSFSVLIGMIVMAAWILKIPRFNAEYPYIFDMQFNAALGVFLAGMFLTLELFAPTTQALWLKRVLAGAVLMIGMITVFETVFDIDLRFGEFFIRDYTASEGSAHPGRMHLLTAMSMAIFGFVLWLRPLAKFRLACFTGGLIVFISGYFSIFGYAFRFPGRGQYSPDSVMAFHTSLALMCLAGAALISSVL